MVSQLSVGYFESRGNCWAFKSDKGRRTSACVRLDKEKIVQIGGLARL
jgi:hypothetical protein